MKLKQILMPIFACMTFLFSHAQDDIKTDKEQCEKEVTCAKPKSTDLSAALASWKGSYRRNGTVYDVFMDVKKKNGEVVSVVSIPQLGIEKQESKLTRCCGNEFHISTRSSENVTITISKIDAGSLKGKVHYEEKDRSNQYALAMNVIRKI